MHVWHSPGPPERAAFTRAGVEAPPVVQISHANSMANKIRNNPSMISDDNKKNFQRRQEAAWRP
jgi:hypothetical protein